MSDTTNPNRRKPDFIAFTVKPHAGQAPKYLRIGVGFNLKNGGISVLYDAVPATGQLILLEPDAEKPATLSYGSPARQPDFEASLVRDGNKGNSFWSEVGAAYRQDGYLSIHLDAVPLGGKLVLSVPQDRQ